MTAAGLSSEAEPLSSQVASNAPELCVDVDRRALSSTTQAAAKPGDFLVEMKPGQVS
jgi:hypothetical protein